VPLLIFCNPGLKNYWHGWPGIEPTTLDLCSQSGAYDLSATATPQSSFVGEMPYGYPVWFHALNFAQKETLRSVFFKQIRVILRDLRFNVNWAALAYWLDVLYFDKHVSGFLFKLVSNQAPKGLYDTLLSRTHHND